MLQLQAKPKLKQTDFERGNGNTLIINYMKHTVVLEADPFLLTIYHFGIKELVDDILI